MQAVHNCEGRGMVSPIPPVEIVEFFMQHPSRHPIRMLFDSCDVSLGQTMTIVRNNLDHLLETYSSFEALCAWFRIEFDRVVERQTNACRDDLRHMLEVEEAYIFTDDASFVKEWTAATQKAQPATTYVLTLRSILNAYYGVVSEAVASYAPKLIVHATNATLRVLQTEMSRKVHEMADVDALVSESEETEQLRRNLLSTIQTTETCLARLADVMTAHDDSASYP